MSSQNQQGSSNDEMLWVGAAILIGIIIFGIWNYARFIVVWLILGLDLIQFYLLMPFIELGENGQQMLEYTKAMFDGRLDPNDAHWESMILVTTAVGNTMKLPISIVICAMAAYVFKYMKGGGFKRTFSLAGGKGKGPSLALYQAEEWGPVITGAMFDPHNDDPRLAPAKTPLEWMRDNGVALSETNGLDRDAAEAAFEAQLGQPWPGLDKAPVHVKTLIVFCILNARRDKNKEKLMGEVARAYAHNPKAATAQVAKIIEPYLKDKKLRATVDRYAARHHYTTTLMFRLLLRARQEGGEFACAKFLWLKPVDRNLWYALQNVGRRAYHIEGAGVVSHYQVEFLSNKPVPTPHVSAAVDGVETYLEEQEITNLNQIFVEKEEF